MAQQNTAEALWGTLTSPNEMDANFETANVVDGLFAMARAISSHGKAVREAADTVTAGLNEIANALHRIGGALEERVSNREETC